MTAAAVLISQGDEQPLAPPTTLTLLAGAKPPPVSTAEVVVFHEARADLPRPYVTSDEMAEEARRAGLHQREWESRERARAYLVQIRSGDPGADGAAMRARPHKDIRSPSSARMPWKRR